jgi:hypothetical protein
MASLAGATYDVSVDDRATYLRHLGTTTSPADVARAAADALDDDGLREYGLDGYHLGLLRLFGSTWPIERIRDTARSAARERAWQDWRYKHQTEELAIALGAAPDLIRRPSVLSESTRLTGWATSPLPALLKEGQGVLVACFVVGGYRFVPVDAVLLGHRVTQPTVTEAMGAAYRLLSLGPAWFGERYKVVDIQASAAGSIAVARALKRGQLVLVNIDGLTNDHGEAEERNWSVVSFAGTRVRVLNGMVRLAASCGATVVPLVVPRVTRSLDRVEFGAPIRTPRLRGDAMESYVQATMETLYAFLGAHVMARPEEWERLSKLHEILRPEAEPDPSVARRGDDLTSAVAHLDATLGANRALRLNERRVARMDRQGKRTWVDAFTLRAFVVPEGLRALNELFDAGEAITASSIVRAFPDLQHQRRAAEVLARLWMRGALIED